MEFKEGSEKEILSLDGGVNEASLVVANLIAPILEDLFDEGLGALVFPGGKIILSGILKEQIPAILSCLEKAGFKPPEIEQQEEWVGLIAVKRTDL